MFGFIYFLKDLFILILKLNLGNFMSLELENFVVFLNIVLFIIDILVLFVVVIRIDDFYDFWEFRDIIFIDFL